MKKKTLMPPKQTISSDMFMTPDYAITPLLPHLSNKWTIWECACGSGNIVKVLSEYGFKKVIPTDISTGIDFLNYKPIPCDCIITNPPFSKKNEFLKRCYEIGKPFALLLPLTALETEIRQSLFRKHGLQLILFNKRIHYAVPSGKRSHCWFPSAWFTNWLNLPKELNYVEI